MAAGGGDGELAVGAQPLINPFGSEGGTAVGKTGGRQDDRLLGTISGSVQVCLAADKVLWAALSHVTESGLLAGSPVEDQVDPGYAAKAGIYLVEFVDKVIERHGRQEGFGEQEETVVPDGRDLVQGDGTHSKHCGLTLYQFQSPVRLSMPSHRDTSVSPELIAAAHYPRCQKEGGDDTCRMLQFHRCY